MTLRLIRRAVKQLLRSAGIDIRFVPKIGFDAYADMHRLAATERPVVFDVGANRGQTIERMRRTFARPVIHSFEPSRDTFAELQRRVSAVPDLTLNNVALGARGESRTFIDSNDGEMSSFLEPSVDGWGGVKSRYPVEVSTIDDYCAARGVERIDVLKSDTQGFDLEVIKGAERMIAANAIHLIFMEITFSRMYEALPRLDEIYAHLTGRGFTLVSFYDFYYQRGRAGWTDALFVADGFEVRG